MCAQFRSVFPSRCWIAGIFFFAPELEILRHFRHLSLSAQWSVGTWPPTSVLWVSPWGSYSAPLGASFLISLDAFKTKVTGLQTGSLTCELQFSRPPDFYYFQAGFLALSSLANGLESTWSHRCLCLPENGANVYGMPNAFSPLAVKLAGGLGGQHPCWCFFSIQIFCCI